MTEKTPQMDDDNAANKTKRPKHGSAAPRKRKKRAIPDVDEILHQLMELNGVVLTGSVSAKQADLIHKNLRAVLQVQLRRETRDDAGPATKEGLVELCRNDPQMLNAIEPFLSDEQVERLMAEVADNPENESV
ncbi:MAG: hypothetical protein IID45_13545 [Planctomycetes bacterium]|nr:hypothetical protein [Planctomycetota bacterium]